MPFFCRCRLHFRLCVWLRVCWMNVCFQLIYSHSNVYSILSLVIRFVRFFDTVPKCNPPFSYFTLKQTRIRHTIRLTESEGGNGGGGDEWTNDEWQVAGGKLLNISYWQILMFICLHMYRVMLVYVNSDSLPAGDKISFNAIF